MELKELLKIIRKNIWTIFIIAAAMTILTYYFSLMKPDVFRSGFSVTIASKVNISEDRYGGYYTLLASQELLKIMRDIAESGELDKSIFSDLSGSPSGPDKFKRRINVFGLSPVSFNVIVKSGSREENEKISVAFQQALNERFKSINKNIQDSYSLDYSQTEVTEDKPPVFVNSFVALVMGIIIGVFFVFIKRYLKEEH